MQRTKLDKRIYQIMQDPEIYLYYYNEKYKTTVQTIKKLQEKNIPPEFLLNMRAILAELGGKRAIALGALQNYNEKILVTNWNYIIEQKANATKSFKNLQHFEDIIVKIEQTSCNLEPYRDVPQAKTEELMLAR